MSDSQPAQSAFHPDQQQSRESTKIAAATLQAVSIMARLRGPKGCPWDREQTFDSIKRHTLEETYEVFDAIERRAWPELKDELGDLLLQVLFYAQMASEAGYFNFAEVVENLNAKLIRRHPHVFGATEANDSAAVLRNWEQIKQTERTAAPSSNPSSSILDSVPRSMPAVMEAAKLGSKAAKAGFDWPSSDGLFDKLQEEMLELQQEIAAHGSGVEAELGDILFTAVNLARHLNVDPESALRATNAKFRRRFGAMEAMAGDAAHLESLSADALERLWQQAKDREALQIAQGEPDAEVSS